MARTYTISGSLVTVGGDPPFDEGKDDWIELDLVDDACDPIADIAVESITATLRSDTDVIINDRDEQDVLNVNDGTLLNGTFRLDLSGDADLVAIGKRPLQNRELTLIVTHSTDKVLPIVVRFKLRAFVDVGA